MGQTCVCANRLYAQDKIYDQFVEKLSKKVGGDEDRRRHRTGAWCRGR
jgi:acyl-CoA reductase-like NAD-dependent aldehyde dehydrogenase